MSMVIYVNGLRIVLNNQIAIWTQNVSRRHYSQKDHTVQESRVGRIFRQTDLN